MNYELRTKNSKGFTLVEILIVVAILGILAAIVLPEFQGHVQQAKEAAAKDNLRILREAIERYAAEHNDVPPGYNNNDPSTTPTLFFFNQQMITNKTYLSNSVQNPFNNRTTIYFVKNDTAFPDMIGYYGWIYQPQTKTIKLDWPGIDSQDEKYTDY
jgi:prepilin-type N-terminal cleavage/methylation domain-containing protein